MDRVDPVRGGAPVLRAAVAAGAVAVLGVEIASAASRLSVPLAAIVALATIAVFVAGARFRRPFGERLGFEPVAIVVIALVTLVISLVAAPNTWDSMTYHLARIDQWLARGSVAHYPTAIDRQIWQPPFGEYLMVLARALGGGGDRLVNLVQWAASLGCAAAAARIAELVGLERRGRWLAALLVLTTPTIVLQATSTQTDLIGAFWVVTTAAFVLEELIAPSSSSWLLVGGALALGIGTKGTALVFGAPWVVALAIQRPNLGRNLRGLLVAGVVVGCLNAPWMLRNVASYGSPLGDPVVHRLLRPGSAAPAALASNLVANASVHWALPGETARRAAESVLTGFNRLIGADPGVLYPYFGGLRVEPWSADEDLAGNPLLFLAALATVILASRRWGALGRPERWALVTTAGGVVLFGLTVRWQPYNGRLQMAGFVLAAPLVAAAAERLGRRSGRILAVVMVTSAVPPLLTNTIRPVLGPRFQMTPGVVPVESIFRTERLEQYFARQPAQYPAYRGVIGRVIESRCEEVAVKAGYDSWEHPLWVLSRGPGVRIRFEQVEVANATGPLAPAPAAPCALIAIDQKPDWSPGAAFTGWSVVERVGRLSLWRPGPPPS